MLVLTNVRDDLITFNVPKTDFLIFFSKINISYLAFCFVVDGDKHTNIYFKTETKLINMFAQNNGNLNCFKQKIINPIFRIK